MAKWGEQWQAAKKTFEASTGQKKPSQKFILGVRKGTGIEDALKKCDSAFAAVEAVKSKSNLDTFAKAIAEYKSKATAYGKVLTDSMEAPEKAKIKPEIDVLMKHLTAIGATMDAQHKGATVAAAGAGAKEFTAKTLVTNLAGGIQRAMLFSAKVKAAGTPASFNEGIVKASRDITQYIGNVEKLRAEHYTFPHGDPTNLFKVMAPWAQGNRMLKPDAPKDLVIREIGAFNQAVAGVKKWVDGNK